MSNPKATSPDRRVLLEMFDDGGLTSGRRDIRIHLPAEYSAGNARYPVMYFTDGGSVLSYYRPNLLQVDLAHDALVDEGRINPVIIVAIFNTNPGTPTDGRMHDLTPGGGLGGYYRFIAERLKPYIDAHFRTLPEPEATVIAGMSRGGSAAFIMAHDHPDTFGVAGCMSPSLWSDNEYALNLVREANDKRPIRFWLDAGGGEYEMWRDVARAHSLLERRGWTNGDDVAAYFDYPADHHIPAGRDRMREMLHFILRKDSLQLQDYRLVYAANPTARAMDMNTDHRRIVGPEAWYSNGLRLTVPDPNLEIEDTTIVTPDSSDPLLLHPARSGVTRVSSTYQGRTASLVIVARRNTENESGLICRLTDGFPTVDDTQNWPDLTHEILDNHGNTIARFDVSHDGAYVHVAVSIIKSVVTTDPDKQAWEQDSAEFRFDGRATSVLLKDDGYNETDDQFLTVAISPRPVGEECVYSSSGDHTPNIPTDAIGAGCALCPGGYRATLAIPVRCLNAMQEGAWSAFRLNLCINWLETADGPMSEHWWQPNWYRFESLIGSGVFVRQDKVDEINALNVWASAEEEFLRSWDDIERYYFNYKTRPIIRNLIAQMRAKGYDKLLRAGSSVGTLILSRSRQNGLRIDQARIMIDFESDSVNVTAKDVNSEKTLTFDEVELVPRMESMMKELASMAID